MKKLVFALIIIAGIFIILYLRPLNLNEDKETNDIPPYSYIEDLHGIGCIRLGMTISELSKSLDSLYLCYSDFLKKNNYEIDFVDIKRKELLKPKKTLSFETPETYAPEHKKYNATLILSEYLAVNEIEVCFYRDTLYRIHISNSNIRCNDVGEALISKYGYGEGYYRHTSNTEEQLHQWGNERCIVTYNGKTTYTLNNQGLANGVASWFHDIEAVINDQRFIGRIDRYLSVADSLYQADRYKNL